jgi:alpha-glucoside transport system permease protein
MSHTLAPASSGKKLFSGRFAATVVWIFAAVWTTPLIGLLVTSFRPKADIQASGWWTFFTHPSITLDNYHAILIGDSAASVQNGILPYVINSLVITIPAVIFPITLATMAAYTLAWVRFKGSDTIFYIIFALQIVPIQLSLIPLLQFFTGGAHIGHFTLIPKLGIANTFAAIWIPHTMFGLPLAVYLLYNFISAIPRDLLEAAVVDGADHFTTFRRIVLPLSVPAIAAFAILQFLWVWNDLLVALSFSSGTESISPLNAKIGNMVGAWGAHWEYLTAGAFIVIIVPLIVFFSLQRYFVRGILAGSVK